MSPQEQALKNRARLIAREQQAQRELLAFYGVALRRVRAELRALEGLGPAVRGREHQLELFQQAAGRALAEYARQGAERIRRLQEDATGQAVGDLPPLLSASLGPGPVVEFAPPHPSVPASLIGFSTDGTPLGSLLGEVAGSAAAAARRELVVGSIRGHGPREVARAISKASGVAYDRSLLIARAEMLRAYRTTTLSGFEQNRTVVKEWSWLCAYDTRTCPACWAMSGTTHPVDESLNSHLGCRCLMLPRTASWAELGFHGIPDSRPPIQSGEDVFAGLSAADQRKILGPGKYAAYSEGRLSLPDLVQPTVSPRWGKGLRVKSLRDALAA